MMIHKKLCSLTAISLFLALSIAVAVTPIGFAEGMRNGFTCKNRKVYVGEEEISIKERISSFNKTIKATEAFKKAQETKLKKAKSKDRPKIQKKINDYKKAITRLKSILSVFKAESLQCTEGLFENFNIIDVGKGFFNGTYNLSQAGQDYTGQISFSFDIFATNSSMVSLAMDNQLAGLLGLNFAAFSVSLDQSGLKSDGDHYQSNLWTEGSYAITTRTSDVSFSVMLLSLNLGGATADKLSLDVVYQDQFKQLSLRFNTFDSLGNLLATGSAILSKS